MADQMVGMQTMIGAVGQNGPIAVNDAEKNTQSSIDLSVLDSLERLVSKYAAVSRAGKAVQGQMKKEFEALIEELDREYEVADQRFNREMTALQPVLAFKLIDVRRATMALENFLNTADENLSEELDLLVTAWRNQAQNSLSEGDDGEKKRLELRAEIEKQPRLCALLDEIDQANSQARPVSDAIDLLQQTLTYTANHRVKVRFAYADALASAGLRNKSQEIILQAMSIQMGLPVEELRRSKKRRKEQDRSRRRRAAALETVQSVDALGAV